MAYIIEDADLIKDSGIEKTSILIKSGRIQSIRTSFKKYNYIRMNASPFIMTPTHTILEPEVPEKISFQEVKQYYIDSFLKKGCTVHLTYASVEKEYLLKASLDDKKKSLLNSPIDFILGIKIPIKLLTPNLLRMCRKEKIPAVFVEIAEIDELKYVPWGWVREAMFPYNCTLVPIFKEKSPKLRKLVQEKWTEILASEKLPFIEKEIQPGEPLSHSNMCKIGIFPLKSNLNQGAEVSYNFYLKDKSNNIEQSELILYHSHRLLVTVHKGTVIRAGEEILFRPGFGEQVMIKTPSFFSES